MGMYENDPFGNLGCLQTELFRAVRWVVDTAMFSCFFYFSEFVDYLELFHFLYYF